MEEWQQSKSKAHHRLQPKNVEADAVGPCKIGRYTTANPITMKFIQSGPNKTSIISTIPERVEDELL